MLNYMCVHVFMQVSMYVSTGTCVPQHADGSQRTTFKSQFSLSVRFSDWTQVIRLDHEYPYPTSHLTSRIINYRQGFTLLPWMALK